MPAKKNPEDTFVWIALAVGGFLIYKHLWGSPAPIPANLPNARLSPAQVTASATYQQGAPANAFVGGGWNSGAHAPQWIQCDLGGPCFVSEIRLLVEQDPPGRTVNVIYGGPSESSLGVVATHDAETASGQNLIIPVNRQNIRFLRIVTTESPSWVGWRSIEVWGSPSQLY